MALNLNINMATATILDLSAMGSDGQNFSGTSFSLFRHCVKFGANPFRNARVIAV